MELPDPTRPVIEKLRQPLFFPKSQVHTSSATARPISPRWSSHAQRHAIIYAEPRFYDTHKSIRLRAITAAFVNRPRNIFAIGETKEDSIGYRWNAGGWKEPRFKCDEGAGNPSLRLWRHHQGRGTEEEAEVHAEESRRAHAEDSKGGGYGGCCKKTGSTC